MAAFRMQAHSYELDEQNVLFDERRERLYVLNSTASYVWDLLSRDVEPARIANELASLTGADNDEVAKDVTGLIERWRKNDLIGVGPARARRTARASAGPGPAVPARAAHRRRRAARGIGTVRFGSYRILDFSFRLDGDADLAESCRELLAHLAVDACEAGQRWPLLEVYRDGAAWELCRDGRPIDRCTTREGIVPMVHANTLVAAYYGTASVTVVHAAAVCKGESCAILPAQSGSGKSTLTAALAARGFGFCADDLAALTGDPVRLLPAPLRLGIKSGSWDVLRAFYPSLDDLPVYRRADNKRIRYLLPPRDRLPAADDKSHAVNAVIFPHFTPGQPAELEPMSRGDALLGITEAGYDRHLAIDRQWVDSMIAWIAQIDCYRLQFDELESAVEAVASILP